MKISKLFQSKVYKKVYIIKLALNLLLYTGL